jgi:hypothetical protein
MNKALSTGMYAGFTYLVEVVRPDGSVDHSQTEEVRNLMPTEGMNHMLNTQFRGGAQVATWYIGLYAANYTPTLSDVASTFATTASEVTALYDEANRVAFVEAAAANGAIDNSASRAEFTFNGAATVYGGFISSAAAKGALTGVLASVVRFASAKVLEDEAVLRITAGFTLLNI